MCRGKSCRDLSTPEQPIEIHCPACDGEGCDECGDGWFQIDGCPSEYAADLGNTLRLVDLFKKGLPPVAGGSLDQSAWFVSVANRLESEEGRIMAEG